MHLSSKGLPAGHAVTIWFVALQNPQLCKKNPCTPVEAMGMPEMDTVAVNGAGRAASHPETANRWGQKRTPSVERPTSLPISTLPTV